MDSNTYNKINEPKTIETININGKYVNAADFKSKIVTASTTSAFLLALAALIILLFI